MPAEHSFNLLVVEDDPGTAEMLHDFFISHGMTTTIAQDGVKALKLIASFKPDIIIMDIVLPYLDGISVLDELRNNSIHTPVILLTNKKNIEEKLQGFECGADDYITKPFSLRELLMRVHAVLRRGRPADQTAEQIVTIGSLSLNPLSREAILAGSKPLALTKTEFDLLYFLAARKNMAVAHEVLLEKVLGYDPTIQTKALVMHIVNIRKKFKLQGLDDISLQAVPGIGYKLVR